MASAVGQIVDVPIIIRSLAESIGMLQQDDLPIPFHPDFLMTLDIGAHETVNNSGVVGKYELSWWAGRKPRSLDLAQILDLSNIIDCLDTHKKQLSSTNGEILKRPKFRTSLTVPTIGGAVPGIGAVSTSVTGAVSPPDTGTGAGGCSKS
jgi:hypothetical protein